MRKIIIALLAGTTALTPAKALAMPGAIAGLILPLITASPIFFLGPAAISAVSLGIGYAVTAAALYGLQAALAPDKPSAPKPEDGKISFKQSVPSLSYILGRVRKAGDYDLLEESRGIAYHILVLAGHRIHGYIEHWLHDEKVTLDANGAVTEPAHFYAGGGTPIVKLRWRDGLNAETAYSEVIAAFPEIWTEDHRGDGLASVMMSARTVSQENYLKVYPQQMPQHSAVIEGALLYDPRDGSTAFSTNLALERFWHLTHPVGGKLSSADMYAPEWQHAADVCDENVTNRDGGSEERYHGGFWFRANNDPVEIGRIMDQAAELVVYERPDGLVGVHAGEYTSPDIRLIENDIVALSFDTNRRRSSNVIAVRGEYTDPAGGKYVTTGAAPYGDPYAEDSERTRTVKNQAVQSHNHMARLEKITFIRANAPRVSVLAHYHAAKNVPYRRFVRVHVPPRLEEAVIELTGRPKLSLKNLTVEFQGIVVPSTLYDFDAATEEGEPGATVVAVTPTGVPAPEGFDVVIQTEVVSGGATAAYALASWTHIADVLTYELEWEWKFSTEVFTGKQSVISTAGEDEVRSGYLADGRQYRFRLRTWSGGQSSGWTDYVMRTATADPVAPDEVTGALLTGGGSGEAAFAWTAPNSANYFASRLYLNLVDDVETATLAATEYGAPGAADSHTVGGLTAGTYYGWIVAINASGTPADPVTTGSATIT